MRSIVLVFIALLSLPSLAAAEEPDSEQTTFFTLEEQNMVLDGELVPDLNGTIVRMLHGPIGTYTFFYVDRSYAVALAGPLLAPAKWLAIGAGFGIETSLAGSWRVGGMVWVSRGRWNSTTFIETGASGPWARSELAWKPSELIGVGFLADTLVGVGPRLEINIPRTRIQLWGAPLVDVFDRGLNGAFGIRLSL